jgi:hypothetical protein
MQRSLLLIVLNDSRSGKPALKTIRYFFLLVRTMNSLGVLDMDTCVQ